MPICKRCHKFSNVLAIDRCEHCGEKDWEAPIRRKTFREDISDMLGMDLSSIPGKLYVAFASLAGIGVAVVIFFFGLWALVALLHWMWNHS